MDRLDMESLWNPAESVLTLKDKEEYLEYLPIFFLRPFVTLEPYVLKETPEQFVARREVSFEEFSDRSHRSTLKILLKLVLLD